MSENNNSSNSVALIGDAISVSRVQMHLIRQFGAASLQGTSSFNSDEGNGRVLSLKVSQDSLRGQIANFGTGDRRISHTLKEMDHNGSSILAMILS